VAPVYPFVLIGDCSVSMRTFLHGQRSMPLGATVAVMFFQTMTNSQPFDIGGPADVIVLSGVVAIRVYAPQSMFFRKAAD
jgi:hypothetical protein